MLSIPQAMLSVMLSAFAPQVAELDEPPVAAEARAWTPGTELRAVREVTMEGARVVEGSRVTVVAIRKRAGVPVTADVALADGHVCRAVPLSQLALAFE